VTHAQQGQKVREVAARLWLFLFSGGLLADVGILYSQECHRNTRPALYNEPSNPAGGCFVQFLYLGLNRCNVLWYHNPPRFLWPTSLYTLHLLLQRLCHLRHVGCQRDKIVKERGVYDIIVIV
jgi:hypothetical protein